MSSNTWKFWIDVGGTFTDVVAVAPDGKINTHKLLSSGKIKGRAEAGSAGTRLMDASRASQTPDKYVGYSVSILDKQGNCISSHKVSAYDAATGTIIVSNNKPEIVTGMRYELFSNEPAPVVAIRELMGLRLDEPVGEIEVRLGTTRGTNALLERKGARTAFMTTRGFGDVLRIGTQARPDLFDLNVRKPEELYERVVEVDERISASGSILNPASEEAIKAQLTELKDEGVQALAVCLMNSYRNDEHEVLIEKLAAPFGFDRVSLSSRVAAINKIVSRGDTTVVDAYLTPVVRAYVKSIRTCIPDAHFRLMTSAGGLNREQDFDGKDSVLSGPAGGVVGFSKIAEQAGFKHVIGFDMGGTSTDVSRYDGRFEYQFETQKAGIRIVTPMLAIETVAAGGGSICSFDGQKLTVGPESAGSDPGPACYGRGGPLAVTDLNVFLGRVPQTSFPFPLDFSAIEARLASIADRLLKETRKQHSKIEIAEGFLKIANERMASSIKDISVAKGYDVRTYCLVSFGGAGAQHACAIARLLGMSSVLLHPFAGVLSAYGMGLADVKKFWEDAVLEPLLEEHLRALKAQFVTQEARLKNVLRSEGIPDAGIKNPRILLELRYVGQSATITIEACDVEGEAQNVDGYRNAFIRKHIQLFGHEQKGRALEIVTARLEVSGTLSRQDISIPQKQDNESLPKERSSSLTTAVVFNGKRMDARLLKREDLRVGDQIDGPAIILERTSTIVLEPNWQATVRPSFDLLLTYQGKGGADAPLSTEVDPIQLEIFNNKFASCAEQMGATLQRTALSTNVKERLDFSCAIFNSVGNLVANAPHVPVHLGAMSRCVKAIMKNFPDVAPGDVWVTNDPFQGGSHLPDVTVVTPVHDPEGHLLFFTASRAHHAEIGGTRPGSMPPDATNLEEEGVLIRPFKLMEDGHCKQERLLTLLGSAKYPSRAPLENWADIQAQMAANQAGANELLAMVQAYGDTVVQAYMGHIQDAAEKKMRAALKRLPDGEYRFEDCLDDGSAIKVCMTINGEEAIVDFAGSGAVMRGNLNANPAIVTSAVLYVFRCLINEDIPLNSGVLNPVELRIPEGLLNPKAAEDPALCPAVACGNVETSQRVVDVLLGALKLCAASQGTMNNFIFGDESFAYFETVCGGTGAGPNFHGADAVHSHMTNTRLTDPEILEDRYPIHLRRFEIRRGSGGVGKFKGGDGVIRELEFLKALQVCILSSRRITDPYGVAGGRPGSRGENILIKQGEEAVALPWQAIVDVEKGDRICIKTPGGGGWGVEEA